MSIPSDYKELLKILNAARVKYLIVGAYAVTHYTEPRYTKNIDLWIEPSVGNGRKVYQALKQFGAPLANISPQDFTRKNLIYQIGVAPIRIDIIMGLPGLAFEKAWPNRTITSLAGIKVNILGLADLIKVKGQTGREVNGNDLKNLRYVLKKTGQPKRKHQSKRDTSHQSKRDTSHRI